ncbi:hypothetical protein D3C77_790800 [compost metagenome]
MVLRYVLVEDSQSLQYLRADHLIGDRLLIFNVLQLTLLPSIHIRGSVEFRVFELQ